MLYRHQDSMSREADLGQPCIIVLSCRDKGLACLFWKLLHGCWEMRLLCWILKASACVDQRAYLPPMHFIAYLTMAFLFKGEPCVMGERKIFKKRKPGAQCALGRDYSGSVVSEPCVCADWDFEWWVLWRFIFSSNQIFTWLWVRIKMELVWPRCRRYIFGLRYWIRQEFCITQKWEQETMMENTNAVWPKFPMGLSLSSHLQQLSSHIW